MLPIGSRTFAIAALLCLAAVVTPRAATAQDSYLQGLSPEAIADLVASARPGVPAPLLIANREITVLRAVILGRSPSDRVAAVRELVASLTADGRPLSVSSRFLGTAAVIS